VECSLSNEEGTYDRVDDDDDHDDDDDDDDHDLAADVAHLNRSR